MVGLTIKNNTGKPYEEVRDMICKSLVGNKGFIENDIIISDQYKDQNTISIILGDDGNNLMVDTYCSLDHIKEIDMNTGEEVTHIN